MRTTNLTQPVSHTHNRIPLWTNRTEPDLLDRSCLNNSVSRSSYLFFSFKSQVLVGIIILVKKQNNGERGKNLHSSRSFRTQSCSWLLDHHQWKGLFLLSLYSQLLNLGFCMSLSFWSFRDSLFSCLVIDWFVKWIDHLFQSQQKKVVSFKRFGMLFSQ